MAHLRVDAAESKVRFETSSQAVFAEMCGDLFEFDSSLHFGCFTSALPTRRRTDDRSHEIEASFAGYRKRPILLAAVVSGAEFQLRSASRHRTPATSG